MKQVLVSMFLVATFSAWAGELKLKMHGSGFIGKTLHVAVHSSDRDFLTRDDRAIKSAVVAKENSTELVIANIPAGEYAVAVFADMNGNGKLDSNFIGIPKEPVGLSRHAKGRFGPPKFADAAFMIGNETTVLNIELE